MMTPNGGVFGRNPTFNNVTVDGNLTVNGDFTLGDDIVINDTLLVNGQATFRGGIISIPNATAPTSNTVLGSGAGASISTAINNTVVGTNALLLNTASDITAVGANALDANTTGTNNTAVGKDALGANSTGAFSVAIGDRALQAQTTATENTVVGSGAGVGITNGGNNTVVGTSAGFGGNNNTAIGRAALNAHTGSHATAVGQAAALLNTANDITAVGSGALDANTTGTGNTAVGKDALGANTTGVNAVALGNNAGHNFGTAALPNTDLVTSATGSIFIGRDARPGADSQTNQIVIGDQGRGNGSNTTTIGNSSTTGTFIPAGDLTLTNGNLIVGTSGKGIDFSATANSGGTMTSELLSDYEEGTWTPTVAFGGASVGVAYAAGARVGRYTKIGRAVSVTCYVALSNKGSSTGSATITGLPFTVGQWCSVSMDPSSITFTGQIGGLALETDTVVALKECSEAGSRTDITDADFANSSAITMNFTYTV